MRIAPIRPETLGIAAALSLLTGGAGAQVAKALAPIPAATLAIMAGKDTTASMPLVIRTYKKEAELEIWKQNRAGRYVYIKTFPICRWSGQLGPKRFSGDRQTPEGFYAVGARQMNPNSHYFLSFDTGFPNAYDKAHGASGSAVMVHGTCSSMGCFAMTDKQVGEIYAIARDALKGGQPAFGLQAFPFRMSAKNMALYRNDRNIDFWRQLKEGSDRFEATGEALDISVVAGRYVFAASHDPVRERAALARQADERTKTAALIADGSAAVATTYADGGQHAIFAAMLRRGASLGVVSRPEALAYAGLDVTLVPARRHRSPPVAVAARTFEHKPVAKIAKVRMAPLPDHLGAVLVAERVSQSADRSLVGWSLIAGSKPVRSAALVR